MSTPSYEKMRVFVVDDDPYSVRVLVEHLKTLKIVDVTVIRTLNRAFDVVSGGTKPDLVILDLFMPDNWGRLPHDPAKLKLNGYNQGQLLGAVLDRMSIPYFYYTAQRGFYTADSNDCADVVAAKSDPISDVVKKVKTLLNLPET